MDDTQVSQSDMMDFIQEMFVTQGDFFETYNNNPITKIENINSSVTGFNTLYVTLADKSEFVISCKRSSGDISKRYEA